MKNVHNSLTHQLEDLIYDQRLKNLVFLGQNEHHEDKIKNGFQNFLKAMAFTVGLIIYGYFDNPYEDGEIDDAINERKIYVSDEEEEERFPQKHIKKE